MAATTSSVIIFIVEILFHLFHLSILILLIVKRRTVYKGQFYLMFIIVLTADLACFIFVSFCYNSFLKLRFFNQKMKIHRNLEIIFR